MIAAAFIGPGTLATASASGASHKFRLVWALLFATIACIVLQEAAARITIASGRDIGQNMIKYFQANWLVYGIGVSVILGCGAYEAGNILGAIAGINLIFPMDQRILVAGLGLIGAAILWFGNVKQIANILGVLVATMGVSFIIVALQLPIEYHALLKGSVIPVIPQNAEWLVLGLIGTTIVPYNLFLGSGISKGEQMEQMRFGLTISVLLGGLISIAILIVGTQIEEGISFAALSEVISASLGSWAGIMMAFGLFAAGFTSSITSPLAAAVVGKSIFSKSEVWGSKSRYYRLVWIVVLLMGLIFGILDVKPIPIIIAAQGLNGMILPLIAMTIILLANDRGIMGDKYINSRFVNILSVIILDIVTLIGLNNLYKAAWNALNLPISDGTERFVYLQLLGVPIVVFTIYKMVKSRN